MPVCPLEFPMPSSNLNTMTAEAAVFPASPLRISFSLQICETTGTTWALPCLLVPSSVALSSLQSLHRQGCSHRSCQSYLTHLRGGFCHRCASKQVWFGFWSAELETLSPICQPQWRQKIPLLCLFASQLWQCLSTCITPGSEWMNRWVLIYIYI